MNIAKISFIDAVISFFASLALPTWDCTEKDMNDMGIVKGHLGHLPVCSYSTDMVDDIRLDDDLSLYGVFGIPQKRA